MDSQRVGLAPAIELDEVDGAVVLDAPLLVYRSVDQRRDRGHFAEGDRAFRRDDRAEQSLPIVRNRHVAEQRRRQRGQGREVADVEDHIARDAFERDRLDLQFAGGVDL